MKLPKVSVIIPFYSREDWLFEAVESALNQTYSNIEIIVINDGSNEDISGFLNKYGDRIKYIYKKNSGPGSTRNMGIEIASGDYIAFLDSDDLWLKQKLTKQIAFMEKNNYMWSHTKFEQFWEDSERRKIVNNNFACEDVFVKSLVSLKLATPSLIIKRAILHQNSNLRFANDMRYGQDSFFYMKIAYQFPLGLVDEVLTLVRMRGANAALKAKVRLQVRNQIWNYLVINKNIYFGKRKASWIIRQTYKMYKFGYEIIKVLENYFPNKSKVIELLSKVLCVLPYSVERIYIILHLREIKEFNKQRHV